MIDQVLRVHHIPLGLGHLDGVPGFHRPLTVNTEAFFDFIGVEKSVRLTFLGLFTDHSLCQQLGKGFPDLEIAEVFQYPGIKTGIEEMKDSVFNPPYVLIHGHPVIHPLWIQWPFMIIGAGVAVKIPGGFHKGIHGIGFPSGVSLALGAGGFVKGRLKWERRPAIGSHIQIQGEDHRKIILRYRDRSAPVTVDNRDGGPPVTLS